MEHLRYMENTDNINIPQETPIAQAPLENEPMHKSLLNQRGSFLLILGAIIVILVVLGAGGYLLTMNKNSNSIRYVPQPTPTPTQQNTYQSTTANWKPYTSTRIGFTIKYPAEKLEINDSDTGEVELRGNESTKGIPLTHRITAVRFYSGEKGTEDLIEIANEKANKLKNYHQIKITQESSPIIFNDIEGYKFITVEGTNEEVEYIYLDSSNNRYVYIVNFINDLESQKIVKQVLSTFRLLPPVIAGEDQFSPYDILKIIPLKGGTFKNLVVTFIPDRAIDPKILYLTDQNLTKSTARKIYDITSSSFYLQRPDEHSVGGIPINYIILNLQSGDTGDIMIIDANGNFITKSVIKSNPQLKNFGFVWFTGWGDEQNTIIIQTSNYVNGFAAIVNVTTGKFIKKLP